MYYVPQRDSTDIFFVKNDGAKYFLGTIYRTNNQHMIGRRKGPQWHVDKIKVYGSQEEAIRFLVLSVKKEEPLILGEEKCL